MLGYNAVTSACNQNSVIRYKTHSPNFINIANRILNIKQAFPLYSSDTLPVGLSQLLVRGLPGAFNNRLLILERKCDFPKL